MTGFVINGVLLVFLLIMATAIHQLRNLFAAIMLLGIYSLLCAAIFLEMDAVDVAFTEAAVGAGISTILMLGALALIGSDTQERKVISGRRRALALGATLITGAVLLYGTKDMPRYGDPAAPIHQHVAPHYIQQSPEEIGLPNIVTSILASYRGYDTMGETLVIFTAGIAVFGLLGNITKRRRTRLSAGSMPENTLGSDAVLIIVAKLLVPLMLLFGLYVQFHGDFGPGGGFQAGVIIAAGLIVYSLIFGIDALMQVAPLPAVRILMASGLTIYAGTGLLSLLLGENFLDYDAFGSHGQHYGIFAVEFGVGTTVAAVMLSIFYAFMNHRPQPADSGGSPD